MEKAIPSKASDDERNVRLHANLKDFWSQLWSIFPNFKASSYLPVLMQNRVIFLIVVITNFTARKWHRNIYCVAVLERITFIEEIII